MSTPDQSHPISIEPDPQRLVVRVDDTVVADTTASLVLREAHREPVHYLPLEDVEAAYLRRSEHQTFCPWKGDATYYDLVIDGREIPNAIWVYEEPYDAMAQIKGHLAFYAQNVTFAQE